MSTSTSTSERQSARMTDIRVGDAITVAGDGRMVYRVEALDYPSIGWLTVVVVDLVGGTDAYAEEWVTSHALALVAGGHYRIAARQSHLPHIDQRRTA